MTYMLKFSENVLCDAVFFELGLNGRNDIVDNSAVDGRLIDENQKFNMENTTADRVCDQLTTILFDIYCTPSLLTATSKHKKVGESRCGREQEAKAFIVHAIPHQAGFSNSALTRLGSRPRGLTSPDVPPGRHATQGAVGVYKSSN